MPFVLDASTSVAWVMQDEVNASTDRLLASLVSDQAHSPSNWPGEVANALLAATRRGRLQPSDWPWIQHSLGLLPIVLDRASPQHVWSTTIELAHDQRLSVFDAMYLELALRMRLPLATLDSRLASAAEALQVELMLA